MFLGCFDPVNFIFDGKNAIIFRVNWPIFRLQHKHWSGERRIYVSVSGFVLADVSVWSLWKLFIFIIKNTHIGSKYPKYAYFNVANGITGVRDFDRTVLLPQGMFG